MWLSDTHGHLLDWATQRWVRLTGRTVSLADEPWLAGPVGRPTGIGPTFFDEYAHEYALAVRRGEHEGLLEGLDALQSSTCDPQRVARAVAAFYTDTTNYELDAWAEWTGVVRPGGWLLAWLFSRRLQQLNVPLSALDTSHGMTSDIVAVIEPSSGRRLFTTWVRRLVRTGNVIYAGAYSTCVVPEGTPCIRVVFPLPNGNAIVIMKPTVGADGSLVLESAGRGFGSAGFYFTVIDGPGRVRARYVRALRERIHVYEARDHVRADHVLSLWGMTFLRLHYRLRPRSFTRNALPE